MRWQWLAIAKLASIYASVGVVLGAVGGLILRRAGRNKGSANSSLFAALTLIFGFAANLALAWPLVRSEDLALMIAGALGIAFAVRLSSAHRGQALLPFSGPFTVSLSLLVFPWVSRDMLGRGYSNAAKTGLASGLLLMILAGAAIKGRLRGGKAPTAFGAAIVTSIVFGVFWMVPVVRGTVSVERTPPPRITLENQTYCSSPSTQCARIICRSTGTSGIPHHTYVSLLKLRPYIRVP